MKENIYNYFMYFVCILGIICCVIALGCESSRILCLYPIILFILLLYIVGTVRYANAIRENKEKRKFRRKKRKKFPENSYYSCIRRSV